MSMKLLPTGGNKLEPDCDITHILYQANRGVPLYHPQNSNYFIQEQALDLIHPE